MASVILLIGCCSIWPAASFHLHAHRRHSRVPPINRAAQIGCATWDVDRGWWVPTDSVKSLIDVDVGESVISPICALNYSSGRLQGMKRFVVCSSLGIYSPRAPEDHFLFEHQRVSSCYTIGSAATVRRCPSLLLA